MKIVVLSGKGGTGKTTVSSNLAAVVPNITLVDTDVEEPNSHIFLKPRLITETAVTVSYPEIDHEKCIHCQACASFCHYNAILATKKMTVPMKELCHDCGGCALVCLSDAITYVARPIGSIKFGKTVTGNQMWMGELTTGELSGVKIIEELNKQLSDEPLLLVDAPPGTSCSTVAALNGADYAIIVTEPTPFGVSDMKMVVELLEDLRIPFEVVINKAGLGNDEIYTYCKFKGIPIVKEIKFNRDIAVSYADGRLIALDDPIYRYQFKALWQILKNNIGAVR